MIKFTRLPCLCQQTADLASLGLLTADKQGFPRQIKPHACGRIILAVVGVANEIQLVSMATPILAVVVRPHA